MGGLLTSEKNTKKKKGDPGDEGRFSRIKSDDCKFYYEMSKGEIKKLLANNTRTRVYSKKMHRR